MARREDGTRPRTGSVGPYLRGYRVLDIVSGSLFNHSQTPNVTFSLDPATESIRYTTTREVAPDEELCIFYGRKLWFGDADLGEIANSNVQDPKDGRGDLSFTGGDVVGQGLRKEFYEDGQDIIQESDLPFVRIRITPDEEEEDLNSVKTSMRLTS